jgi:hypothetical protein
MRLQRRRFLSESRRALIIVGRVTYLTRGAGTLWDLGDVI